MQTCVKDVENAEYAAPLKPLLSMRGKEPLDQELDPRSRPREYVDSKRRLVVKKLCYARPTRRSWPLKQGSIGDMSQPPMILNPILSHNSVSGHFCKQHGNLYMTAKSIFENSNLLDNAFLIWHCTH